MKDGNLGYLYLLKGGKIFASQAIIPGKDNARRLRQYLGLGEASANILDSVSNNVFATNLLVREKDYLYMILMKFGLEDYEAFPEEKVYIERVPPYSERKRGHF